jgi:DNA-binding NarL/FixJ family response regulator
MTNESEAEDPCLGGASRCGALRVVVADDSVEMRTLLSIVLSRHGCEVVGLAVNGEEAVRLAREVRPNVVLMDINMPGMDGIAATAMVRTSAPSTRIVGLSSCQDETIIARMLAAGASAYLPKPTESGDLIRTLRAVASTT